MNNPFDALKSFIQNTQQRYGSNFDPSIVARNMLGGNCNTPQEALDLLFRSGKINQEQYNTFVRML